MANEKPKQGLSSVGVDVQIDGESLYYVKDISDIGGKPDALDATCMRDNFAKSVPGLKNANELTINFHYEASEANSDYRKLKAIETAKKIVPVVINMPDGASYASTGYVSVYINGAKVNELIGATATINLQSDWVDTYPDAV